MDSIESIFLGKSYKNRNYSPQKMKKVLDMVFLIIFILSRRHTLVTSHPLAEDQTLAERA